MDQFCDVNNESDRENSLFHTDPLVTDRSAGTFQVDSTHYYIGHALSVLCVLLVLRILVASRSYSRKILALEKVYAVSVLVSYITLSDIPTNLIYNNGNPVNEAIIKDLRKGNDTTILLQWDPMEDAIGKRMGHVSLFVNGTYMSNWPNDTQDTKHSHVPGVREPIYEDEVGWEGGQPERVLVFPKGLLSESCAITFWEDFVDRTHRYNGKESNCAHFVDRLLLNCSLVYNLAYSTGSTLIAFIENKFFIAAPAVEHPYGVFEQSSFAIQIYESGWFWGLFHLAVADTKSICICAVLTLVFCAMYDALMYVYRNASTVRVVVGLHCTAIFIGLIFIDIAARRVFFNDKYFTKYVNVAPLLGCVIPPIFFWLFRKPVFTEDNLAFMKLVKMDLFSLW